MTPQERKEKEAKLAEALALRKVKVDNFYSEAADKRLENELRLAELEQEKGLTLGIDLGVVWLPTGDMVAVQKPEYPDYEKCQLELADSKPSQRPAIVDELLKHCVLEPNMGKLEQLCKVCGDAKTEAFNLATRMHDVAKAALEGKS